MFLLQHLSVFAWTGCWATLLIKVMAEHLLPNTTVNDFVSADEAVVFTEFLEVV